MSETDDSIPSSYSLPSDNTFFVTNTFSFDPRGIHPDLFTCYYILFALAIFILWQSWYLNGRRMHFVRFCADGCAWCTVAYGFLFLGSITNVNATKSCICYQFLANGIFQVIFQLFDNYIFIQQIEVIKKMQRWKKISIHLYIWLILVLPWSIGYLLVPFFADTNSLEFLVYYDVLLEIQLWGAIAYNCYFTLEFALILRKVYTNFGVRNESVKSAKIIALKSIAHCCLSSTANILYVYDLERGNGLYNIITLFSMHFLFNYKIEKTQVYISNLHDQLCHPLKFMKSKSRVYLESNFASFKGSEGINQNKSTKSLSIPKTPPQSMVPSDKNPAESPLPDKSLPVY
mmetsp:Transcript_12515/g.12130  ORF Transcript_12515/g.12130 Transcript_12515/m.12130 type:complete len:345 (-) Transcript_12515:324-1358(-)